MRDFKGMKRQRGRNRGNNGGGGGGGGKPQHNVNRAFESNGPDNVKIRGNAQHVFEKYQQLARDSSASGDRVLAENYLQHAEHYFRVLRAVQPQRPASEIIGRDAFASGFDIDFEDENGGNGDGDSSGEENGAEAESNEQPRAERDWQNRREDRNFNRDDRFREDRPREDRQRDDRPRDERPREDRQARDERPRDDRQRDDRPRDDRPRDDRPRDDRPRDERPREERPREERQGRRDRYGREGRFDRDRTRDPLAVVEPEATPLTTAAAPPEAEEAPRQLRSQDGSLSPAPAFLQAPRPERPEPAAEDGAEPRRPRRRRAPRTFEGGEGEAPAPTPTETEEV
jgi:hypothetical protein